MGWDQIDTEKKKHIVLDLKYTIELSYKIKGTERPNSSSFEILSFQEAPDVPQTNMYLLCDKALACDG